MAPESEKTASKRHYSPLFPVAFSVGYKHFFPLLHISQRNNRCSAQIRFLLKPNVDFALIRVVVDVPCAYLNALASVNR